MLSHVVPYDVWGDANTSVDSGGTHPATVLASSTDYNHRTHLVAMTGDANVADIPSLVVVGDVDTSVDSCVPHSAVPVLDAEILTAVRAIRFERKIGWPCESQRDG